MSVTIGGITPTPGPGEMTVVRPDKPNAIVKTYSGAAYFAWPASIVGKQITLVWNLMPLATFAALDALYVADAPVVFAPGDPDGKTYNVNIVSLDGKYLLQRLERADVKLTLLIMSQVVV